MRTRPPTRRAAALLLAGALVVSHAGGCTEPKGPAAWVDAQGRRALPADFRAGFAARDAAFDGRVRLLGARVPPAATPGARVEMSLLWLVEKDCAGLEPKVFVHATATGAELNLAQADHAPVAGALSATEWRPGDVLEDTFSLAVPASIGVDELVLKVGLYEGKTRWRVSPSDVHDGDDRVEVARLRIEGAPPLDARAQVVRRSAPLVVDGVLDEPDWARASPLTLRAYDGKGVIARTTAAKMLWDAEALWLAFVGEDPDPFTPYTKNDEPLYESEVYEIFIDADGDADVYVELQSAPNDVHFDAAFAGGRRKNMDKGFDAPFQTRTRVEGATLTQEWRIPVAALRDVPAGEPRVGASWRINLFRLERVRDDAKAKIVRHEASAWSPPLSGDFHNLARMGTITFVE